MRAQGTTAAAATAVGATWHTWAHSDEPRHARGRPGERDAPCAACWARLESWGRTPAAAVAAPPCVPVCVRDRAYRTQHGASPGVRASLHKRWPPQAPRRRVGAARGDVDARPSPLRQTAARSSSATTASCGTTGVAGPPPPPSSSPPAPAPLPSAPPAPPMGAWLAAASSASGRMRGGPGGGGASVAMLPAVGSAAQRRGSRWRRPTAVRASGGARRRPSSASRAGARCAHNGGERVRLRGPNTHTRQRPRGPHLAR